MPHLYRTDVAWAATERYATWTWSVEARVANSVQTVNHAGYTRQILQRNPPRTNEYGDELEDSEEDPEADIDAEDQDPYNDVKLEGKNVSCCTLATSMKERKLTTEQNF